MRAAKAIRRSITSCVQADTEETSVRCPVPNMYKAVAIRFSLLETPLEVAKTIIRIFASLTHSFLSLTDGVCYEYSIFDTPLLSEGLEDLY